MSTATPPQTETRPAPSPRAPRPDDLIVVGGGPAGLARAFWERRATPDARIRVLEAAEHPGGWMQTERTEAGFRLEHGPQTVRGTPEFDALLDELDRVGALDLDTELRIARPEAKVRWLARGDRLRKLPGGPGGLLFGTFLPLAARLRLLAEPFVRAPRQMVASETVASFVRRRLGPGAVPLVQAVVSGIHAGDVEQLEVGAAFPTLAEFEREHGSLLRGGLARGRRVRRGEAPKTRHKGILGFERGLQRLTDALVDAVGAERIECDERAMSLQWHAPDADSEPSWQITTEHGARYRARKLVLAIPASDAAPLVRPLDDELGGLLAEERRASVASVFFGFPLDGEADTNPRMRGFGFLQHGGEPGPLLGCLYSGRLFPEHTPPGHGLLRAMLGGARFADFLANADDDAVRAAADERLRELLGYRGEWSFTAVRRARHAIPQYRLGHRARVERIRAILGERWAGRLDLIGNSYDNIALPAQFARPEHPLADTRPFDR